MVGFCSASLSVSRDLGSDIERIHTNLGAYVRTVADGVCADIEYTSIYSRWFLDTASAGADEACSNLTSWAIPTADRGRA